MKRWLGLLGLILLAGCAQVQVTPDADKAARWQHHAAAVRQWQAWELQGRVALKMGDEGWHARLLWRQFPDHYQLQLSGPFGQGAVQLEGRPGQVVFRQGRRLVMAADAESLLRQELGWELPVTGLRHWVLGIPHRAPQAQLSWDAEGRLAGLQEAGWTLQYQRYEHLAGISLPTKLRLERAEVQVRLVVDDWRRLAAEDNGDG